tara:strand:- start:839 stop:997 length:159 start_codon:yes stop_codon:yes gene_type:complete
MRPNEDIDFVAEESRSRVATLERKIDALIGTGWVSELNDSLLYSVNTLGRDH